LAEAKRLHDQSVAVKIALRLNEHNKGHMAISKYAVWTPEVKSTTNLTSTKHFSSSVNAAHDSLARSGQRFLGPNFWPEPLARFCAPVLTYTDAVDILDLLMLMCAMALDVPRTDRNFNLLRVFK
jgi:isopenicillin N synthase-like dioxygenase